MVEVHPSRAIEWGFLNEEHWVQVNCAKITSSNHLHTVRIHRTHGPIFTEHPFSWLDLALIGKLKDSVVPGCPGLALVWSKNCEFISAPILETEAGFSIHLRFRVGEFTRVLQMYGPGNSLYFFRDLLLARFNSRI